MSHRWKHARFLGSRRRELAPRGKNEAKNHHATMATHPCLLAKLLKYPGILFTIIIIIITHHHHNYPKDNKQELSRSKHTYNSRYNDTQANTSILWIVGGKQVMCLEFMQLVGYSNNLQKTWNRMRYYRG